VVRPADQTSNDGVITMPFEAPRRRTVHRTDRSANERIVLGQTTAAGRPLVRTADHERDPEDAAASRLIGGRPSMLGA
jgi:hypothetical protein